MKKGWMLLLSAMLVFLLFQAEPGFSQDSKEIEVLKEDVKALKEGQKALQADLQEIRKLLQANRAPAEFKETLINIQGAPVKGDKQAKLVLIEFSDYQWPFCAKFVRETMPQIEKEYVDSGKLKHVFMDFPLPMHNNAFKASEAGLCAGDQGMFWQMHDRLFANQQTLKAEDLIKHAEALSLDIPKFKACLDKGKHGSEIKTAMAEGQKSGITGTPAFLIGFVEPDGKVKAVKKLVGAQPYANFKTVLDDLLSSRK